MLCRVVRLFKKIILNFNKCQEEIPKLSTPALAEVATAVSDEKVPSRDTTISTVEANEYDKNKQITRETQQSTNVDSFEEVEQLITNDHTKPTPSSEV